MNYNIMTLDPQFMIDSLKAEDLIVSSKTAGKLSIKYAYDFGNMAFQKHLLIQSIDQYSENALFYQIEMLMRREDSLWDEDSLLKYIFFLDFSDIFRSKTLNECERGQSISKADLAISSKLIGEKVKNMFDPENSISIRFEDGSLHQYVPFDKSASMSRDCRISFIDKEIKEALDKRLLLGLNFSEIKIAPSKFFAYRGLYLSDAQRVQAEGLTLNDASVIVLKDDRNHVKFRGKEGNLVPITLFGGELEKNDNALEPNWILGEIKKKTIKENSFDGEGLVSPQYAELINKALFGVKSDGEGECAKACATSFQVRMPFIKGVLHAVDFHAFINDYLGEQSNELCVIDAFGIQRKLADAQIILTESMLKCYKWLVALWVQQGRAVKTGNEPVKFLEDPMAYFFGAMSKYSHALYVGNTNIVLTNTGRTKLNYQFLNTLDLSGEEFDKLVRSHLKQIDEVEEDCYFDENEDLTGEELIASSNKAPWLLAYSLNKGFGDDPKVKSYIRGMKEAMLTDCAKGRLRVAGECRFLSGDLLSFLIHLVRELNIEESVKATLFEKLGKQTLYADQFYMAKPSIPLSKWNYCGLLRSPHLSRNEQCVLRPCDAETCSLYDKYFSQLTGVIMVSRKSLAPATLSGADFDGDLVKIISDKTVVKAIRKGAYQIEKIDGQKRTTRRLPVVDIPDTHAGVLNNESIEQISYRTIKDTFSNKVGYISNLAVKLGMQEYTYGRINQNATAKCTVVTGLEIDAAKSGLHPNKNIEELEKEAKASGQDKTGYYLKTLKALNSLPRNGVEFKAKENSGDIEITDNKKNLATIKAFRLEDKVANIDRLPYYFAEQKITQKKESTKKKTGAPRFCFEMSDSDWKKQLGSSEAVHNAELLVGSYIKVLGRAREISYFKNRFKETQYIGHVMNLLKFQYDSLQVTLEKSGVPVRDAIDRACFLVEEQLDSKDKKATALKNMAEKYDWPFVAEAERPKVLADILDCDIDLLDDYPEVPELLCNFDNSGYKLLYYLLRNSLCDDNKAMTQDELEDYIDSRKTKREENKEIRESKYYQELNGIYRAHSSKNESNRVWQSHLQKYCRKELLKICNDDWLTALQYVYYLQSSVDRNATFFWDVLPADVILENVLQASAQSGVTGNAE